MRYKSLTPQISIRFKFVLVVFLTSCIMIAMNAVLFYNINKSVKKVDEVYQSNVRLNMFETALNNVQTVLLEYLETKSSESIDYYYRNVQKVERYLRDPQWYSADSDSIMFEKDISNLTRHYINLTAQAVQSKRGRNIEKYRKQYDQAKQELHHINTFIYTLNTERFQANSNSYNSLIRMLHYLEVVCMITLACVTIADLLLIYLLTKRITTPLIQLAATANEIGHENLEVPILPVKSMDEVGVVTNAFNQMTKRLRQYIKQMKEAAEKESEHKQKELLMKNHLKDVQLKYLQAQINPHFLFNTLNAGVQLSMMEDAEQTGTFLEHMADFFRYNLKTINTDTTIEEEVKQINHYLYILNVRFSGDIHYESEIDETYLSFRVPSMILQPIIENAVNHGIRNMEGNGKIVLRIYRQEMFVCISVKDNGCGMQQEQIKRVLCMEEPLKESSDSNGIGINNVLKRLQIYYQNQNMVEIKSDGHNMGTEILLYLPIVQ